MSKKIGYRDDFCAIVSDKIFCICTLLTAVLAYGFATFNMAVINDDLQGYIYVGEGMNMLASGRFTIYLIDRLTSTTIRGPAAAYPNDILAILGLVWAGINFCIFFRRVCGKDISNAACTVFTCVFVSYPLITELWEYTGAYRVVAFGFLCDSFALMLMYDVLHRQQLGKWKKILVSCVLMMLVSAGYESLVPVYIFSVFAVLALQVVYGTEKEKKLTEITRQGLCYAGVLGVGLILRIVVHKIILLQLDLSPAMNGETAIVWGVMPAGQVLTQTLVGILRDYVLRSLIYFPLTELAVAAVILLVMGIAAGKKHGWAILLPGLGMYFSLIVLSLVQGCVTGYRSCQVFTMFVAFTAMFVVVMAERAEKSWLRVAVLILCGYLCFHQADQTNYFLTLSYMRTEEERSVIRNIGTELYSDFDMEKPVIFIGGGYTLSDGITEAASIPEDSGRWIVYEKIYTKVNAYLEYYNLEQMGKPYRKLPQTNVNSVIGFSRWAFNQTQEPMQRLFAFFGYDYILPDCNALYTEAYAYVEDNQVPAYPKAGYIQDAGEYLIVHIQ